MVDGGIPTIYRTGHEVRLNAGTAGACEMLRGCEVWGLTGLRRGDI